MLGDHAPPVPPPMCLLAGIWTHIVPGAFDHSTSPSWTNQACVYEWTAPNNGVGLLNDGPADPADPAIAFNSPPSCLDDEWKGTPATIEVVDGNGGGDGGRRLKFTFVVANQTTGVNTTITTFGTPSAGTGRAGGTSSGVAACSTVDMGDGSLYVRSTTHPFFMPPHEWIRVAARWLLRAVRSAQPAVRSATHVSSPHFGKAAADTCLSTFHLS